MKNKGYLILLFFFFLPYWMVAQYDSIYFDGMQRTFQLHLPTNYSSDSSLALIIAMHGGFGNGPQLETQSQLSDKADAENFIVVYPEGMPSLLNIRTWNAGVCCGFASDNNIDDVGFISALIDTLLADYAIDSQRIYATGMSNGGFMSYRLACELSDKIAAIAPVAASMTLSDCSESSGLPIIHFHSYLDSNIPYDGGYGDGVSSHYNPPLDSVLNSWASIDGCETYQDTLANSAEFTHVKWAQCDCSFSIEYYITQDGGHSWPGGNQSIIGDPTSEFINANDLMWDFFEQYTLGCNEALALEETPEEKRFIKIFPNPSTGTFILVGEEIKHVIVYNSNGQVFFNMEIHPSDMLNINLSGEAKGYYYVRIRFLEDQEEIIKVLLQ